MPLVHTVKPCHCVVRSTFAKWMTSRLYFEVWAFCKIKGVGTVLEMGNDSAYYNTAAAAICLSLFYCDPFSLGFSFVRSRPVSGASTRVVSVRVPAASNTLSSPSKPQPIAYCAQCVVRSGYRQPPTGHSGHVMHTVQQLPQIMKPAIAQGDYCLFFYNIRMKNERG